MFISRLFALATAGLASLSLVAASPIAAPPAPGTQELAKRSNVDYVYNTLVELDLALNVPCDAIYAAVKVGGVTKEILDVQIKIMLSNFEHATKTLQAVQPGDKEPYTPKHKECANLIVVIITKVTKLLYALLYLVIKVPELLTWFAACDNAIILLVRLIDGLLYGVLALVGELLASADIKIYLEALGLRAIIGLYL